jgi:hypothetical protein
MIRPAVARKRSTVCARRPFFVFVSEKRSVSISDWRKRSHLTLEAKGKREAAIAVGALDPGVPYESRWAPYVQVHEPGQGQFP